MTTHIFSIADTILKDYILDSIVARSKRGMVEKNDGVYGAQVHWRKFDVTKGKFQEKEYSLESWYIPIKIKMNCLMPMIDDVCDQIVDLIKQREDKALKGKDLRAVTCYQRADWKWLEQEGKILQHYKTDDADVYTAILIKYAKILDEEGNEV